MEKFVMVYYYDNDRVEVSIRRGSDLHGRHVYNLNNEKRRDWVNSIVSDGMSHVDMTRFVTFSFSYPRK